MGRGKIGYFFKKAMSFLNSGPGASATVLLILIVFAAAPITTYSILFQVLIASALVAMWLFGCRSQSVSLTGLFHRKEVKLAILSALISGAIVGVPFVIRPANRIVELLDNDNIFLADVTSHFAQSSANIFEPWQAANSGDAQLPRLVGAFIGHTWQLLSLVVNLPTTTLPVALAISTTIVFACFAGASTYVSLSYSGSTGVIKIIFALCAPIALLLGSLGDELNMGSVNFVAAITLVVWLLRKRDSTKLADALEAALILIAIAGIWPLALPTAILAWLAMPLFRSVDFLSVTSSELGYRIASVVIACVGSAPFYFFIYSGRSSASMFNDTGTTPWSLGSAPHPLIGVSLALIIVIGAFGLLSLTDAARLMIMSSVFFVAPAVFIGWSFAQSIEQDGYYLFKLTLIGQVLLVTCSVPVALSLMPKSILSFAFQILLTITVLLGTSGTNYLTGTVPGYRIPTQASGFALSATYLAERFDPSFKPFFDGESVIAASRVSKSNFTSVPNSRVCRKPGEMWIGARWAAAINGSAESMWHAYSRTSLYVDCESRNELGSSLTEISDSVYLIRNEFEYPG